MKSPSGEFSHPAVHSEIGIRTVYATDNSIYQLLPAAVALPATAAEVQEIVRENARRAEPLPVVARGGGTGTNGQSLTPGLVVEVKRKLNQILDISPEQLTARVEPGVVTAELNAKLKTHGLFWAPHTSTMNRATVGGMISTDAAGKGSLVHGRAHRHVISVDVVLADGTPWRAEAIPVAEAETRATVDDAGGRLWRRLLDLPISEHQEFELPELARGFSGYGIDRFRREGLIDPVALLCGSEGTLAIITEATIALTPLPHQTTLFVASYSSFREALEDAVELRDTGPTAIESFDETTLSRGRSSPAWPALGSVLGDHDGAVLLLEYSGDELPSAGPIRETLAATGRSLQVGQLDDPADQAKAWKVRADAVGLLAKVATGGPERSARPTAFVEDCVVPVQQMGSFIEGFRKVLDDAGVLYAMFGHADVGCVHVRPALDITDPEHENLVATITEQVVALAAAHGGVLWGEHGRGFRGESVDHFLSADVVTLMQQVKSAFDPTETLNPGKLYRPTEQAETPLVGVSDPPLRGQLDRDVPVALRRTFDNAFACNGNGLCHHYDGAEVMCPSYKATGDPALSPRGRADLLRAWLRSRELRDQTEADLAAELVTNMGQCLSCSACSGHCPVEVNIPELKSQFLEQYYSTRKRPLSHQLLSRFEEMAVLAAKVPAMSRMLAPFGARAVGLVDLPTPGSLRRFASELAPPFDGSAGRDASGASNKVVLLPEVFSSILDPAVEVAATRALESVGYQVQRSALVPSGKFDHVKGKRAAFAKAAQRQSRLVQQVLAADAIPVVVEPAVALMFGDEYPGADPDGPWSDVVHLVDLLAARSSQLAPASNPQDITLLPHCTEQATRPESVARWVGVLEAVGHSVTVAKVGCCGMAGIFGHEADNQAMSRELWDLSWSDPVRRAAVPAATGYSCRSQAKRFGAGPIPHPIEIWARGV